MGENPKTTLDDPSSPADPSSAAEAEELQRAGADFFAALLQTIQADAERAGETPEATAVTPEPTAAASERSEGRKTRRASAPGTVSWPKYALILCLAAAAFLAGIALYSWSRSATHQTAAIEKFQQSLVGMEKQIALQLSIGTSALTRPAGKTPAAPELLDAANADYREGRFQDAVNAYRAAAGLDTGGQFSDEAHYRYGASLLKIGEESSALGEFQAVVAGSPGSPHFAASAMETARLFMEKKNYAQARRTLYLLLAARDRMSAGDKDYVERASFLVGTCLESEAGAREAAQSATLPVARFGPADHEGRGVGASGAGK